MNSPIKSNEAENGPKKSPIYTICSQMAGFCYESARELAVSKLQCFYQKDFTGSAKRTCGYSPLGAFKPTAKAQKSGTSFFEAIFPLSG